MISIPTRTRHILILLETIPLLTYFVCDVAIVMFTVGVMGLK